MSENLLIFLIFRFGFIGFWVPENIDNIIIILLLLRI